MRKETITKTWYKFDELSEEGKRRAINANYDINVDYDWWESTYDDAKEIGLKITAFNIDRGSCKAEFIDDAVFTAHKIKENHGEESETYKTAVNFLKERDEIVDTAPRDEDGEFADEYELDQKIDEVEDDFLTSLREDYLSILRREYEYQTSREQIIEAIQANEMEFEDPYREEDEEEEPAPAFQVVVGNIGTLYYTDQTEAEANYKEYVRQSEEMEGRAAGEDVALFKDGSIIQEYIGAHSFEETDDDQDEPLNPDDYEHSQQPGHDF